MGQNLLLSILVGRTSIDQLFWGSLGARVLTRPCPWHLIFAVQKRNTPCSNTPKPLICLVMSCYIYMYILHILNYIISHSISMFISIAVGFRSLFAWLKHASQAQIIFRWQPWLWWKKTYDRKSPEWTPIEFGVSHIYI